MRWRTHLGWFWFGCGFELLLLVVAMLLGGLLRQPPWADLHWKKSDALWGLAAVIPPLLLFCAMLNSKRLLVHTREFLERAVRPWFGGWSLLQLAIISALAGVCEEALFRGVIQGKLTSLIGLTGSLVLSSLLFGCAHWISLEYAFLAASIGVYLGGLWWLTGNLLVPIVTHGAYDFLALVYFLRIYEPSERRPNENAQPQDS